MKAPTVTILVACVACGTTALAKGQPNGVAQLNQALAAVAASAVDQDQGDGHASPTAILKVCSKDTPAAHYAAICPVGVSSE